MAKAWSMLSQKFKGLEFGINNQYWQSPQIRRQLILWLIIGTILRFLIMPYAAHNDYLSSHWRSEQVANGATYYPTRNEYLSHLLDGIWLKTITPVLSERSELFRAPKPTDGWVSATPADFKKFVNHPSSRWALFSTKFIYFMFDIATGFLLLALFDSIYQGLRVFILWMACPALLYAVYIFGRYEIYSIFFIVLSLVFASNNRIFPASISLGLAILCRSNTILLVPLFGLALSKQRVKQIGLMLVTLLPAILTFFFLEIVLGSSPMYDFNLREGPLGRLLVNTMFDQMPVYPFIWGYLIVIFWIDRKKASIKMFVKGALVIYLLIYVFGWHSGHYVAWLLPFFIPILAWRRDLVKYYWLFMIVWAIYWIIASDIGVFTPYLFSPLTGYQGYKDYTPPGMVIAEWLDFLKMNYEQVTIVARSLLSGVALWIIYQLFQEPKKMAELY